MEIREKSSGGEENRKAEKGFSFRDINVELSPHYSKPYFFIKLLGRQILLLLCFLPSIFFISNPFFSAFPSRKKKKKG